MTVIESWPYRCLRGFSAHDTQVKINAYQYMDFMEVFRNNVQGIQGARTASRKGLQARRMTTPLKIDTGLL